MLDRTANGEFDEVDMDAFHRAMEIAQREPTVPELLKSKLEDEPWTEVAKFAAYHCQRNALGLKPWQSPPMDGGDGQKNADALLEKMLAAGVSQFEPDPIRALAKAKKRRR